MNFISSLSTLVFIIIECDACLNVRMFLCYIQIVLERSSYMYKVIEHKKIKDNLILNRLSPDVFSLSELDHGAQVFLSDLILKYKPKKVLEIGVSAGGSSAIILNALQEIPGSEMHSVDISTEYNKKGRNKKTGFVVDEMHPNLLDKWRLYTGGMVCDFIEEIGGNIDLCFIDTIHKIPGEILDFLMVLPYLSKNAVVVIDDISLNTHLFANNKEKIVNCVLFSAIVGQKIIADPGKSSDSIVPSIGAVILDDDIKDRAFDIFNLLILPWGYNLSIKAYKRVLTHFKKHYDKFNVEIFRKMYRFNKYFKSYLFLSPHNKKHKEFYFYFKKLVNCFKKIKSQLS